MNIADINSLVNIIDKIKNIIPFLVDKLRISKYLSTSHYFKNYHKHLTIYKDGTGIIINSFDIIFNTNEIEDLKRGLNIEDGKKNAYFPELKKMKKQNIRNRFTDYGFWYNFEGNIISSVAEKYWGDDNNNIENTKAKNNSKEIRWIFRFNKSRIKMRL